MLILHAFTFQLGWISFFHRISGKDKSRALFQSMTLIDLDFEFKENKELQQGVKISLNQTFPNINNHVARMSVAMFMAEVLRKSLHRHYVNHALFSHCIEMLKDLDTKEDFSLVPIQFMIGLSQTLGFEIVPPNEPGFYRFDPEEGYFTTAASKALAQLDLESSKSFISLVEGDAEAITAMNIPSNHRKAILRVLLVFLKAHLGVNLEIKSHEVLEVVLHA